MKNLGIHLIRSEEPNSLGLYEASYFVEKHYGNYLLFPYREEVSYDFIKARGGIYKQFINDEKSLGPINDQIFSRYGACGVVPKTSSVEFLPGVKIEKLCTDYYDPDISFLSSNGELGIHLEQRNQKCLFLDWPLYLKKDQIECMTGSDQEQATRLFEKLKALRAEDDYLCFFRYFKSQNSISLNYAKIS